MTSSQTKQGQQSPQEKTVDKQPSTPKATRENASNLSRAARHGAGAGLIAVVLLIGVLVQGPALASDNKNFSIGLSGVVGGPFDADSTGPDPGLDNTGFSAHFAWHTQPQTKVVARVAQIDFAENRIGSLFDPELSYINIGGEYTFREPYYTSGFYLGLGLYQLEGLRFDGGALPISDDRSTVGIALGVTADFSIVEEVSFFADLSFHYADLDEAAFFGFLHVGFAFHF